MNFKITGLGLPFGSISWENPISSTKRFKDLFLLLESKRILVNPIEMEIKDECLESVLEIKKGLGRVTNDVKFSEADIDTILKMINACNAYLDNVKPMNLTGIIYKKGENWSDTAFDAAMKEFRNTFRIAIGEIEERHHIKFTRIIPTKW